MERVGVRELKRDGTALLKRVSRGEAFEITNRGCPIALLVPLPQEGAVGRVAAEGCVTPPLTSGSLADLPPPIRLPRGRKLPSEFLDEMREERL